MPKKYLRASLRNTFAIQFREESCTFSRLIFDALPSQLLHDCHLIIYGALPAAKLRLGGAEGMCVTSYPKPISSSLIHEQGNAAFLDLLIPPSHLLALASIL